MKIKTFPRGMFFVGNRYGAGIFYDKMKSLK